MAYRPSPLVVTARTLSISTSLAASTVALAITAPLLSLTTPEIVLWAWANAENNTRATRPVRIQKANLALVIASPMPGNSWSLLTHDSEQIPLALLKEPFGFRQPYIIP